MEIDSFINIEYFVQKTFIYLYLNHLAVSEFLIKIYYIWMIAKLSRILKKSMIIKAFKLFTKYFCFSRIKYISSNMNTNWMRILKNKWTIFINNCELLFKILYFISNLFYYFEWGFNEITKRFCFKKIDIKMFRISYILQNNDFNFNKILLTE